MRKVTMGVSVVLLAVVVAGQAWGGVLAADPNGMAGWQGSSAFVNNYVGASVDYCVYDKGDFAASFPVAAAGISPDDYVYAYQVDVLTAGSMPAWAYAIQLSVGLDGDEQGAVIGAWDDSTSGLVMPSSSAFATDRLTAKWYFSSQIQVSQHSGILFFSSPWGPEMDQATLSGSLPVATHNLPSPLPEPCTALVLLGGGLFAFRRRHAA